MSSTIPDADMKLSYDCLKCVIQKFEIHFRFRLAERLPKISLAEKAAPLHISELSITREGFELNGTEYRLGVIRHAREGPTPDRIKSENKRGGCPRDIDRFGFKKPFLPEPVNFNGMIIQGHDPERELNDNPELVEARVVNAKNRLTSLEREKRELENSQDDLVVANPENVLDRRGRRRNPLVSRESRLRRINENIRDTKTRLEIDELNMRSYQCKRDNLPSPFNMFIQLTKTSSDGTVHIERFDYDKSLKEAWEYLIRKLFGNRQLVTKIKLLSFFASRGEELVVGLPDDIKFDVQELRASCNLPEILQRVEAMLEHPDRPFTRLELDGLLLEDTQNPKIRDADVLVLHNNFIVDYVALCSELPNKKIVMTTRLEMHPGQYAMIVENLINTKGTLGTCYEFTKIEQGEARFALGFIAGRFENAVVGERLITIPLPNQLQLDISCTPSLNPFQQFYQFYPGFLFYTIRMEVVQNLIN
ncbi:unnamed protein product [Caenorhabditis nigoni]|uniref:Uncharacterized protein n=1 Tax=Caenorhabditis nigoni TaxID=1611254 RepID=A0A2G5VG39_9PELO|nr:hypothetical protein B9Z55_000148 [Caenorhabditis nigoni]